MEGRTRREFVYAGAVVCTAVVAGCTGDRDGGGSGQGQGGEQGGGAGGSDEETPTDQRSTDEEGTLSEKYQNWVQQWEDHGTEYLRNRPETVDRSETKLEYDESSGVGYLDVLLDENFSAISQYTREEFVDEISELAGHMFQELTDDSAVYYSARQTKKNGPVEEVRFRWFKGDSYAEHGFTPTEAIGVWNKTEEEASSNEFYEALRQNYVEDLLQEDARIAA